MYISGRILGWNNSLGIAVYDHLIWINWWFYSRNSSTKNHLKVRKCVNRQDDAIKRIKRLDLKNHETLSDCALRWTKIYIFSCPFGDKKLKSNKKATVMTENWNQTVESARNKSSMDNKVAPGLNLKTLKIKITNKRFIIEKTLSSLLKWILSWAP